MAAWQCQDSTQPRTISTPQEARRAKPSRAERGLQLPRVTSDSMASGSEKPSRTPRSSHHDHKGAGGSIKYIRVTLIQLERSRSIEMCKYSNERVIPTSPGFQSSPHPTRLLAQTFPIQPGSEHPNQWNPKPTASSLSKTRHFVIPSNLQRIHQSSKHKKNRKRKRTKDREFIVSRIESQDGMGNVVATPVRSFPESGGVNRFGNA